MNKIPRTATEVDDGGKVGRKTVSIPAYVRGPLEGSIPSSRHMILRAYENHGPGPP